MLNAELTPADRDCLDDFVALRKEMVKEMSGCEDSLPRYEEDDAEEMSTHELLISEVIN